MGYVLGIDLGTTYSAAATHRDGRAQIVSIGSRTAAVPSVVFLRQDEAILTGEAAERRALTEPGRVAREFKRRLGDTTPIMVGGTPYSAEQLSAELLKTIVGQVVALEGSRPDHITVCHPANWGPYKKDLMQQAVELAGLTGANGEGISFITEPEAAAIHYASTEHLGAGELLAVYDLGGGTFDASVLRKTDTGFEMLGDPRGIERLGGIDFDAAVFNHVKTQLGGAIENLDATDPTAVAAAARLRDECIEAKEALSSDSETSIPVLLPSVMTEVRLTRGEFEAMIRPALSQTIGALERTLATAGVEPAQLSKVLLVGGSSRIPLVAQLVSSALERPVVADAHPKHAIALGAAIAAAAEAGGLDTVSAANTTVLVDVGEEASLTRAAAATAAVTGVAALPHPASSGWQPDPTSRHTHRYFDGTAWTDDVADGGVASQDPLAEAVASARLDPVTVAVGDDEATAAGNGAPPPPVGYVPAASGGAKPGGSPANQSRGKLLAVGAAAVVVIVVVAAVAVMALGGGGGGGSSAKGTGTFSLDVAEGKGKIQKVHVPAGSVLLAKAVPHADNIAPVITVATDFQTIDKYRTHMNGVFELAQGTQDQSDFSSLAGADLGISGGILEAVSDSAGQSPAVTVPVPFDVDFEIVLSVNAVDPKSFSISPSAGNVDLQLAVRTFPEPVGIDDGGFTYDRMVKGYYDAFLQGKQDIGATPDFKAADEVVAAKEFSDFSTGFTDFSDPADAFTAGAGGSSDSS